MQKRSCYTLFNFSLDSKRNSSPHGTYDSLCNTWKVLSKAQMDETFKHQRGVQHGDRPESTEMQKFSLARKYTNRFEKDNIFL